MEEKSHAQMSDPRRKSDFNSVDGLGVLVNSQNFTTAVVPPLNELLLKATPLALK